MSVFVFYQWIFRLFIVAGITFTATTSAYAEVPQLVIDQCSAKNNASQMPDCLKKGMLAFQMLELAKTEQFYGKAAIPVISTCENLNDMISTQWICFDNAAEKAAETRALIGVEKMTDTCSAAISDPEVYAKLDNEHSTRRDEIMGTWTFGLNMYSPFKGCRN